MYRVQKLYTVLAVFILNFTIKRLQKRRIPWAVIFLHIKWSFIPIWEVLDFYTCFVLMFLAYLKQARAVKRISYKDLLWPTRLLWAVVEKEKRKKSLSPAPLPGFHYPASLQILTIYLETRGRQSGSAIKGPGGQRGWRWAVPKPHPASGRARRRLVASPGLVGCEPFSPFLYFPIYFRCVYFSIIWGVN